MRLSPSSWISAFGIGRDLNFDLTRPRSSIQRESVYCLAHCFPIELTLEYVRSPNGILDKLDTPLIVSSLYEGLSGSGANAILIHRCLLDCSPVGIGKIRIFVPITLKE